MHPSASSAVGIKGAEIDTIVVQSEAQALLLENNLIKEHQPRFNVNLRDDKRYPFLAVTLQERYPRILVTRQAADDGARYFGPFRSEQETKMWPRMAEWLRTLGAPVTAA